MGAFDFSKIKKVLKKILKTALIFACFFAFGTLIANLAVVLSTCGRVVELDEIDGEEKYDLIIVLGCGVRRSGEPTSMLDDRINTAVLVHEIYPDTPILMSGDHSSLERDYNEVGVMKNCAIERGMDESIIECDGYGVNTYDSIARAIEMHDAEKVLIITHRFHTYRAVYTALCHDCDAYAVCADLRSYWGKGYIWNPLREILARDKDFIINILNYGTKYGFQPSFEQIQ